jgi:hypothetical protein
MPRTSDIYSVPPGTDGVPNTTISSSAYNSFVHDVETDLNTPRPVIAGGTGANNATQARVNLGITSEINKASVPACGRLVVASGTVLVFTPFNGDKVKINGVIYNIGSGISATINNCFVNNVPNQSLVAGTVYLVTVFNNSGTPAIDFFTNLTHSPDTTNADNLGVETSSINRSRTVIGMVFIQGSTQFVDTAAVRGTISWFNRQNKNLTGANTNGVATASGTVVELTSGARTYFLTWANEDTFANAGGFVQAASVVTCNVLVGLDNSTIGQNSAATIPANGYASSVSASAGIAAAEGTLHYFSPMGVAGGATINFYVQIAGMMRG